MQTPAAWPTPIRQLDGLRLAPDEIDTNIVIFEVDPRLGTAAEFAARLQTAGLLVLAVGKQLIRMVTHLDVSGADIERAAAGVLRETIEAALTGSS